MVQAQETTETPTVEQLTQERDQVAAEEAEANSALAKAVKAFDRAVKENPGDTENLLTLGDKVREAKDAVSKIVNRVEGFTKRIAFATWQMESADLTAATTRIYEGFQKVVALEHETLARFGATQINGIVVLSGEATGGVKAIGDRIPKAPSKSGGSKGASKNGGGGFASHGKVIVQGVEYPSTNAAYRTLRAAADGVAPADVTPANNTSATNWLNKHAGGVTPVA